MVPSLLWSPGWWFFVLVFEPAWHCCWPSVRGRHAKDYFLTSFYIVHSRIKLFANEFSIMKYACILAYNNCIIPLQYAKIQLPVKKIGRLLFLLNLFTPTLFFAIFHLFLFFCVRKWRFTLFSELNNVLTSKVIITDSVKNISPPDVLKTLTIYSDW